MICGATILTAVLAAAQPMASPVTVVQPPDGPVRLEDVKVLNQGESPLVLLYSARNLTGDALEQFTVTVLVFDREGTLKARQVAPGRRTLDPNGSKYSAMVLDGYAIGATDRLVVGVDQAQKVGSETWWRADIRALGEQTINPQKR